MKYKHIFLRKSYVVAVFYRRDKDIDQSRLFVCNKYDSVRIELAWLHASKPKPAPIMALVTIQREK